MSATHLTLSSYFAARQQLGKRYLADAILDLFAERAVAHSVMLHGIAGFGQHRIVRSDETLTLSEDPTVAISATDTAATISALASDVADMTSSGLITLESARLLGDDPTAVSLPEGADEVKLTMHIGRNRHIDGRDAFEMICELLHGHHFAGACVLLGVDGICIISHGSSGETAIVNAIKLGQELAESGMVAEIAAAFATPAS